MARIMNPFILTFIKKLMESSGETIPEDDGDRRFEDLYALFENLLGKNTLASAPPDRQQEYLKAYEADPRGAVDKVGEILADCIGSPDIIMRKTLIDFSELYRRNREKEKEAAK